MVLSYKNSIGPVMMVTAFFQRIKTYGTGGGGTPLLLCLQIPLRYLYNLVTIITVVTTPKPTSSEDCLRSRISQTLSEGRLWPSGTLSGVLPNPLGPACVTASRCLEYSGKLLRIFRCVFLVSQSNNDVRSHDKVI